MGALQDIIAMYGKGGIEVATYAGTGDPPAEKDLLIRSVIQPNAGLITWVRPGFETGDVVDKHTAQLQNLLQSIKDLRRRLNTLEWLASITLIFLFNACTWDSVADLQEQAVRLLISVIAILLLKYVFKYLVFFLIRRYIQRKLLKYFSPSTL